MSNGSNRQFARLIALVIAAIILVAAGGVAALLATGGPGALSTLFRSASPVAPPPAPVAASPTETKQSAAAMPPIAAPKPPAPEQYCNARIVRNFDASETYVTLDGSKDQWLNIHGEKGERLVETDSGREIYATTDSSIMIEPNEDGRRLMLAITGELDNKPPLMRLWDLAEKRAVITDKSSNYEQFSSDGHYLMMGHMDSNPEDMKRDGHIYFSDVKLWDVETLQSVAEFRDAYPLPIGSHQLLVLNRSGDSALFEFGETNPLLTIPRVAIGSMALDGKWLGIVPKTPMAPGATIYEIATGRVVATLDHIGIISVAIDSKNGTAVTVASDRTAKLWRVGTAKPVASIGQVAMTKSETGEMAPKMTLLPRRNAVILAIDPAGDGKVSDAQLVSFDDPTQRVALKDFTSFDRSFEFGDRLTAPIAGGDPTFPTYHIWSLANGADLGPAPAGQPQERGPNLWFIAPTGRAEMVDRDDPGKNCLADFGALGQQGVDISKTGTYALITANGPDPLRLVEFSAGTTKEAPKLAIGSGREPMSEGERQKIAVLAAQLLDSYVRDVVIKKALVADRKLRGDRARPDGEVAADALAGVADELLIGGALPQAIAYYREAIVKNPAADQWDDKKHLGSLAYDLCYIDYGDSDASYRDRATIAQEIVKGMTAKQRPNHGHICDPNNRKAPPAAGSTPPDDVPYEDAPTTFDLSSVLDLDVKDNMDADDYAACLKLAAQDPAKLDDKQTLALIDAAPKCAQTTFRVARDPTLAFKIIGNALEAYADLPAKSNELGTGVFRIDSMTAYLGWLTTGMRSDPM